MKTTAAFKDIAKAMAKIDFCMMQTKGDDGIESRPMSNNGEVEYDGDSWFFARRDSNKVRQIEEDPRTHLAFCDNESVSFIAVYGMAEVVEDDDLKKKLWQKDLERWFENGPESDEVVLIRVRAERLQSWGRLGDHDLDVREA